jgi:hypothetical protein
MPRRFDMFTAATAVAVVTGFLIWQFFVMQHAAEAQFGRAMHLHAEVAGSILVITNRDSAVFHGCTAVVNGQYRSSRRFLLPAADEAGGAEIRLSLAEFKTRERLLDWRTHRLSRLEVSCDEYADLTTDQRGASALNPDALSWVERPARWVGRL